MEQHEASQYGTFKTEDGKEFTLRISNHNASVSNFDESGESEGVSIVISKYGNRGIRNNGTAHVSEFFYPKSAIERAEGKPLAEIIGSIQELLRTGEYTDTTGLAQVEEVNGGNLRFRDNGNNAATHPEGADNELRGVALEYNKRLGKGSYQAIEAIQDSMRSLLEVQRILEERSGQPLEDWENAYMAENAMSSHNNAEYEAWKRDNYKPLTEAVRALMESEG